MEKGTLHLKQFFIVETSVFLDKNVQKIRFFPAKNTVLSLKYKFYHRKRGFLMEKSTLHLKQYFIVETSVILDKNVQKIRFFPAKNTVLSLKYKFYHRKRGFLMEKGTLHLKQNFIVETSVFLDKNVQKIRFFPAKNTVLSLKYKF